MSAHFSEDREERGQHNTASRSDNDQDGDHPLNPISRIIPNPLSDTTTTASEGDRPTIVEGSTLDERDDLAAPSAYRTSAEVNTNNRVDDSWNSNTLTLNMSYTNDKEAEAPGTEIGTSFKKVNTLPHTHTYSLAHQKGLDHDWEATWEKEKQAKRQEKIRQDLKGWRGGHGAPRSNYCPTALPPDSHFGGHVTGTIGTDLPKEILRIERDWSTGDVCQFETSFPIELERRIRPTQFQELIMTINTRLISAYSTRAAVIDNLIAIATWWTSLLFRPGHFEKELRAIEEIIAVANKETFNPAGLNVLSPRLVALQFLEVEYY